MRTIGAVAMLLLVGALAADAPAGGDPPAGPKKQDVRVLSEEEWFAKVKDIQKIDVVGVKKADVLAREAARSAIRVRVKIWDIRVSREGQAIDIMDVMPSRASGGAERLSRDPITLSAEDRDAVAAWKKWDRLAFKVKPKITPDGALEYTRAVASVADLERTPNPGIEYPPVERPLARADSFRDWIDRYTRACSTPDWRSAWKSYGAASSMWFPMTATVRGANDGGHAARGSVSREFDIVESTGVTGYGLLDNQSHPRTLVSCEVEDPQVNEALRGGVRAEVYLQVHGLEKREDLEVHQGHFQV